MPAPSYPTSLLACFRPTSALRDLHAAVAIENTDPVVFVLRAVCMQVTPLVLAPYLAPI